MSLTIEEVVNAGVTHQRLKKLTKEYKPWQELLWYQMDDAQNLRSDRKLTEQQYLDRRKSCIQTARTQEKNECLLERLLDEKATLWKALEEAGTAYAKNRTLENADRLYEALYNVPIRKDGLFDGYAAELEAEGNVDRNAAGERDLEERSAGLVPAADRSDLGSERGAEAG